MPYPLKFEPIFRTMPWGGDGLPARLRRETDVPHPIGEAWLLSDVDGNVSTVANGTFAGMSLRDVLADHADAVFGDDKPADGRFPLLLKLLDARQELSVQVHPDDAQAVRLKGDGFRGKTEAWVVLEANPVTSRLYAGFAPGMTEAAFRAAVEGHATPAALHQFAPNPGDCVFLKAGTVHAIGSGLLLFEVQQTSDITYRLYDWGRVDAKTGLARELHLEDGLACSDFAQGPCDPVTPTGQPPREGLVDCPHFSLVRHTVADEATVGEAGRCRIVTCIGGSGLVGGEAVEFGDVLLLPASLGRVGVTGRVTLLESGLGGAHE